MTTTPILDQLGISPEKQKERLSFLGLTDTDRERLRELAPFFHEIADGLLEAFYDQLLSYGDTAAFLKDPDLVTRLKGAQRSHFLRFGDGVHDSEYLESRLRVGMAHARVGLPPHLYLGSYGAQLDYIQDQLFSRFADDPQRLRGYLASVRRAVLLDIELATDAYIYGGFVERSLAESREQEAERARTALLAKEAQEAQREELLGMVVHDIRSPVTAMIATARAGLRRHRDTEAGPGKQFALIDQTGASVLEIIDAMLTLSRVRNGIMPVHRERFDATQLTNECVEQLRSFYQQTGHTISVKTAGPLEVDSLDPLLVRRVLSNLLVNAVRHTPGGTHVDVSCSRIENHVVLRVADDGPGIPAHVADRLPESLADESSRSMGAYADTGLGLPFCWLACRSLGGAIHLDPDAEPGACFVVELPIELPVELRVEEGRRHPG